MQYIGNLKKIKKFSHGKYNGLLEFNLLFSGLLETKFLNFSFCVKEPIGRFLYYSSTTM